jgi:hypothetical protein
MNDTTSTTGSPELTAPHPGECLPCFIARMVGLHGCDNSLRWARRWRDLQLPRASGLERRLRARGGYCDCEVLLNGWMLGTELEALDDEDEPELDEPGDPPPCPGVPSRSDQPCDQWVDVGRGRW